MFQEGGVQSRQVQYMIYMINTWLETWVLKTNLISPVQCTVYSVHH